MLNYFRTALVILMTVVPSAAVADYVPHPLDVAEQVRSAQFIVVGTVTKSVDVDSCPQSIEITLKPERWLKGDQKVEAVQITSSPVVFLNLDTKVPAGTRVIMLYSEKLGYAYGLAFPLNKERDLGIAVQNYFQIQQMPDGVEKDAAFLAFAKSELAAPQAHEIIKFSIANDLGKAAKPSYRQDKDLEATVFNASQKSEIYTSDALCGALAKLQSPRLVDACVNTAKRQSPWWLNRVTLAPLVADDKAVRDAITELFSAEQNPARQWFLMVQYHKAKSDDQRQAYKAVWTKNRSARETISKFLNQAQSPLTDFLTELQKIE